MKQAFYPEMRGRMNLLSFNKLNGLVLLLVNLVGFPVILYLDRFKWDYVLLVELVAIALQITLPALFFTVNRLSFTDEGFLEIQSVNLYGRHKTQSILYSELNWEFKELFSIISFSKSPSIILKKGNKSLARIQDEEFGWNSSITKQIQVKLEGVAA